jgi:hypothetical protein
MFAFATFFSLGKSSKKTLTNNWSEINEYQELITKTYGKAKKGNLELIKANSILLFEQSEALTVESMPAEFRNPKTIETLVTLKKQTKTLYELMQQRHSNSDSITALTNLHATFQQIIARCND